MKTEIDLADIEAFRALPASIQKQWAERQEQARKLDTERRGNAKLLILVCAQHPLKDGRFPDQEFTERLALAHREYSNNINTYKAVEIYVPGSRHMHHGKEDLLSLSAAGVAYLASKGVPAAALHGDDLNDRYKGDATPAPFKGVYCSADEIYVAASYFKDEGFSKMLIICAEAVKERVRLHCIANGVPSEIEGVQSGHSYHKRDIELTIAIPQVLLSDDPTFQGNSCIQAMEFRQQRKPGQKK